MSERHEVTTRELLYEETIFRRQHEDLLLLHMPVLSEMPKQLMVSPKL